MRAALRWLEVWWRGLWEIDLSQPPAPPAHQQQPAGPICAFCGRPPRLGAGSPACKLVDPDTGSRVLWCGLCTKASA